MSEPPSLHASPRQGEPLPDERGSPPHRLLPPAPGRDLDLHADERRRGADRRKRSLHSLITGNVNPRRRGPRRSRDGSIASTDWHERRWMVIAILILLLSITDAVLTLTLVQHGALEANPVMAIFVRGSAQGFAVAKIGLTAAGVVLLTQVARVRAFGRLPVGVLLYGVLAAYAALILYELRMLYSIGHY